MMVASLRGMSRNAQCIERGVAHLHRSMNNYSNGLNIIVDLDAEQGRTGGRTPNAFRLVVRPTKTVNLAVLNAWLQGRAAFGESVLEALSMCPLPSFTSCDHD